MPTVGAVRAGIADTVKAAIPELNCYDTVADVVQAPAIVVRPEKCDYVVGMGSCQEWTYAIYVLVPRTETNINQNQLDVYISATGSTSVVAAIRAAPGLGVPGVDAVVTGMEKYGGSWESARVPHIGAQLNVRVLVTE